MQRVRCHICKDEHLADPVPTLSPSISLASCPRCGKRTPSTDLGPDEPKISPTRKRCEIEGCSDDAEPGGIGLCSDHRIDDEAGMAAVAEEEEDRIQRAYREWRATPDGLAVIAAIRRSALELRSRGWRRYGIQALAEVVRFDRAVAIGPDAEGYKVNNSHLSRLARDLMDEEPDLRGFFETRDLRSR